MGESISSGILAAWHIKDGDYVEKEQVLYELETDKITSEASAEVAGVISIKVPAEEEVDIGQVVAVIDESVSAAPASEDISEKQAPTSDSSTAEAEIDPEPTSISETQLPEPTQLNNSQTLSPAARKAAEETRADLSSIDGSGKDGRITKSDILEVSTQQQLIENKEQSKTTPITDISSSTVATAERLSLIHI